MGSDHSWQEVIVPSAPPDESDTVAEVAATSVDLISSGWITHSAPILDLGLDIA